MLPPFSLEAHAPSVFFRGPCSFRFHRLKAHAPSVIRTCSSLKGSCSVPYTDQLSLSNRMNSILSGFAGPNSGDLGHPTLLQDQAAGSYTPGTKTRSWGRRDPGHHGVSGGLP